MGWGLGCRTYSSNFGRGGCGVDGELGSFMLIGLCIFVFMFACHVHPDFKGCTACPAPQYWSTIFCGEPGCLGKIRGDILYFHKLRVKIIQLFGKSR